MAELAKSYKFLLLTITVLAFGVIFFGNGQAKAANAEWPGNSWGADTEISIRLSQNKNHPSPLGTNTTFILWSKTPGSKSVDIVKTLCGDKNGSEARVTPRSDTSQKKVFSQGNCGNKTITLPTFDNEELVGDTKYYKYLVDVELRGSSPNDNQWLGDKIAFFQFRVSYDDAGGDTKVGFKSKPGGNALPFISTKGGQTYLPNINIPVGQCSGNDTAIQKYQIYDSDNNKNLFAQPDDYRPVKYKLSNATAVWNWDNWESNTAPLLEKLYWPVDGSSGGVRSIGYAIASSYEGKQPSERPHFRIKDLGGGNYTVIGFPFDELPIDCPLPPPPPDPCLGTDCKYNWAIAGKSEVQSLAAIGDTVTFNNDQYPASSPGWSSDIYVTDTVDARVIMTYNGAQIGSYDFTTKYPENPTITKSKPISKKLNQTGRYCTYIHYPVGFLGKRKAPNYDTDGPLGPKPPSGHTYRWVFIPGRDVGNSYDINRANRNMSVPGGGYDQWWLGSTTDETPNGATDQYWSFHDFNGGGGEQLDGGVANNWRWESKDIDNNEEGRKLWEVYGWWNPNTNTYNSWPFSFNSACVDVIDPDPGVDVSDYEKGTGDKTVTHNIDLGVTTCPAYSATVIVDAFVTGNESDRFYSEPVTANFGGSNCTWSLPKQISGANLDARPPGTSVTVRTNIVSSDKDGQNQFIVYEVPFARFYGNDIYSQTNIDFNTVSTDIKKGSIVEYAAIAASDSPGIGTGVFAYPSNSLLKARSSNIPNPTSFALPNVCSNVPTTNLSTITEKSCFLLTGDLVFNSSTTYNQKITIGNSEDVFINGDIVNSTSNGNYSDPNATGVLLIKAKNIYISPTVKRIDAILFATESVATCATNVNGTIPEKSNWHKLPADGGCRNPLTINGAIESSNIKFSRTGGSRLLNNGSRNNSDTLYNIDARNDAGYASGEPAEIVNFPLYLYFARPYVEDTSVNTFGSIYDSPPRR